MSPQHPRFTRFRRVMGLAAAAASIAIIAAGCSADDNTGSDSQYGFPAPEQVKDSPITIWVDADRTAIVEAFKEDHPEIKVNVETYDGNAGGSDSFHTKISLFDQAGEGWPDVVWSTQVNDASWAAKESNGVQAYAAALDQGVIDQEWLDGYTAGALDPVTVDGHVYGVRDNLAPVVFWYNKALFDEFGYDIPETWEDYEALGEKLAAEHPGYILGSIGDPFTAVLTNMWSAQAPIYTLDGDTFSSDFSDDHTTRMIELMDNMFANGTLGDRRAVHARLPREVQGQGARHPRPDLVHGSHHPEP